MRARIVYFELVDVFVVRVHRSDSRPFKRKLVLKRVILADFTVKKTNVIIVYGEADIRRNREKKHSLSVMYPIYTKDRA